MYKRITIFNKDTGKHMLTCGVNDKKGRTLLSAGHIKVDRAFNENYMFDGSSVVEDKTRKQKDKEEKEKEKQKRKAIKGTKKELEDLSLSETTLLEAVEKLRTIVLKAL